MCPDMVITVYRTVRKKKDVADAQPAGGRIEP